jgi:hypothetical protein
MNLTNLVEVDEVILLVGGSVRLKAVRRLTLLNFMVMAGNAQGCPTCLRHLLFVFFYVALLDRGVTN